MVSKIEPGLGPQRRTEGRDSKRSDQDEGEGLGPKDKGHPQGRAGVAGTEVWGGVGASQRQAGPVDLRDQSAQGCHCTDRQKEAQQGVGTGQVSW